MTVKVSDHSGEAWISAFNEQAEQILRNKADELAEIKDQVNSQLFDIAFIKMITCLT